LSSLMCSSVGNISERKFLNILAIASNLMNDLSFAKAFLSEKYLFISWEPIFYGSFCDSFDTELIKIFGRIFFQMLSDIYFIWFFFLPCLDSFSHLFSIRYRGRKFLYYFNFFFCIIIFDIILLGLSSRDFSF
jgi:hypothetical protein